MKEQYGQEMSQIHVPDELLDRTRQAMLGEEERLKARKSRDRVVYLMRGVAVAAIFFVIVTVAAGSAYRNNAGQSAVGMQLSGKGDVQLQSIDREQTSGIEEFIDNILDKIENFFK